MRGRLPAPATDGERRTLIVSLLNGFALVPLCLNGVNRPSSPLRVLHGAGLVLAVHGGLLRDTARSRTPATQSEGGGER